MAKILVNNNGPLHGEVEISGAKNAVLPLLAATLMTEETCVIEGTPELADVDVMKKMLLQYGAEIDDSEKSVLKVTAREIASVEADPAVVQEMRASIFTMGPMLARAGKVVMPMPGGCTIGKRPIDLHLKGFRALGAEVIEEEDKVIVTAPDGLVGDAIYLDFPSVGATENILMAATLAKGITVIENAAKEPEIIDLANQLNKMGAKIKSAGTDMIRIEGVEKLNGCIHAVIPDRIEAGTFMLAAAITRGRVLVKNAIPGHVRPIISKLKESGVKVDLTLDGILVDATEGTLIATDIKTLPYPGFPTDIQSPFMAFLTTVKGESIVRETVFENRFMHVIELNRMGAGITTWNSSEATIPGGKKLYGAKVRATDLRAGAAMVLAGLVADGTTEVSEIYHIERGYENFVGKFKAIGADIMKINED
ncbi:MAG: UDP-N-acetylglucosamine 1-carboxyvinyltransferase [Clostridiales bacterium]|nr:UDP-N-acetylglucosamine 1-carboxyvinyltransferase [Candidatus Crickella caballi]